MEGDKTKVRPWLTKSTFHFKKENISHNIGVRASKERLILVKTRLLQDFHSICYILRTRNIGGKKNPKHQKNPKHPLKSQISNIERSIENVIHYLKKKNASII